MSVQHQTGGALDDGGRDNGFVSARREPSLTVTFDKVVDRSPIAWWKRSNRRGRVRGGHMPRHRPRVSMTLAVVEPGVLGQWF